MKGKSIYKCVHLDLNLRSPKGLSNIRNLIKPCKHISDVNLSIDILQHSFCFHIFPEYVRSSVIINCTQKIAIRIPSTGFKLVEVLKVNGLNLAANRKPLLRAH